MYGLLIGILTFFLIGLFHPLVIHGEYYLGRKTNYFFVIGGVIFVVLAVFLQSLVPAILCGVTACCCFWSIIEIRDQELRVLRGWYPENPKRHTYYVNQREAYIKAGKAHLLDPMQGCRHKRKREPEAE